MAYLAAVADAAAATPDERPHRHARAELARLAYQNLLEAYTFELNAKHMQAEPHPDDADEPAAFSANLALRDDDVA